MLRHNWNENWTRHQRKKANRDKEIDIPPIKYVVNFVFILYPMKVRHCFLLISDSEDCAKSLPLGLNFRWHHWLFMLCWVQVLKPKQPWRYWVPYVVLTRLPWSPGWYRNNHCICCNLCRCQNRCGWMDSLWSYGLDMLETVLSVFLADRLIKDLGINW